jgi:vacuolar-type H+-ATPase subunit I/STV1
LEYYEFFGKFFSGSGLPFRPFSFLGKEKEVS